MTGGNIYFIRHGQTDWNVEGRFQGSSDIPLNDEGRNKSRELGRHLARYLKSADQPGGTFQIISSPLLRAYQTAELVSRELPLTDVEISQRAALREVSFGDWEGMTTLEVKAAFPIARKARKADRWEFCPPGGESPASRVPELRAFIESIRSPAIVVTHTGVIRICLCLMGFLQRETALVEPISQDKIYLISNGSLARI